MFDCHYDLLSYIYMNKDNVKEVKKYCKKVFNKDNITGGIFNLFYMSPKEMEEELNVKYNEINIIENLKLVKSLIKKYDIISSSVKYIIGIEGLDYLQKIDDIDILYSLGLRSTNPVWSNQNKFGGGIKAAKDCGLTKLGEELIYKLVNKKIAIDLSHANEKTFFDIIEVCNNLKNKGLKPVVFASHSNTKALCNYPRNLSNKQILEITKLGGVIGLVSIKKFCSLENERNNKWYEEKYIEHIKYLKKLIGSIDNIAVSTDDMRYYKIEPEYYQNMNIYKQECVKNKIAKELIKNNFTNEEIDKIMYKNIEEKILSKIV